MDVLLVVLTMLNTALITLGIVGWIDLKKLSLASIAEAKIHSDKAASFVNTAHESVSSTAEQVVTLTKRFDDLKNTVEILKLRMGK